MSGFLSAGIVGGPDIPDSGVARWTFDTADTSGSTAVDVWNGNDGTINGATTGVSGANQTYTTDEAYSFTSSDTVTTPVSDQDVITYGCWINPDESVNNGRIIQTSTGDNGCGVRNDSGTLNVYTRISGTYNSARGGSLPTGSWSHVVGVFDGANSQIRGYVNGSQVASTSIGDRVLGDTLDINQGAQGNPMSQDIDDVRIYSTALSDTEVSNWYSTGSISG